MAEEQAKQGNKNEKVGQVVSTKMQKTIVVEVSRRVPHPLYKRIIGKRKKFYAHDEAGSAKTGDLVRIVECRPLSKRKGWKLAEVIGGAAQGGVQPVDLDVKIWGRACPAPTVRRGAGSAARSIFMIGMRTILEVADNSGARRLACILPRGGDLGLRAGLGDVVTASVKEAAPDSAIKKGKVVRCVIVRMRKETRRKDGTYIRFDSNAAVLINETNEPVGTRVFGPVARELRDKKFMKIVSLAPEVI
jgi:large subunit ribosomal protein L14